MIKDYNLFINEEYKIDDISDYNIDIMDDNIKRLMNINKNKSAELQDEWDKLIKKILKYYKSILENVFEVHGIDMTREMFYKIKDYLTKTKEYEDATQVIIFDLTSFIRNLIKK